MLNKKVRDRLDNFKDLGYSSAGIVVESAVGGIEVGNRVACAGIGYTAHAEMVSVPHKLVVRSRTRSTSMSSVTEGSGCRVLGMDVVSRNFYLA